MPDVKRRAQTSARVARRRLHEEVLERRFVKNASVHHRIERHAARHTKVFLVGHLLDFLDQIDRRVFQNLLRAGGDIPMMLGQLFARQTRFADFFDNRVGKLIMLCQMMIENFNVEMKIAAAVFGQNLFREKIVKFRFAVSRQTHYFPFIAGKHIEADVIRHG